LTESFNSLANETAVTAGTVRRGHGYPADRVETSPEPTGWQGSDAADAPKQGAPIGILAKSSADNSSNE
jgi:hypothetical protein